jgi:hypothetical protein
LHTLDKVGSLAAKLKSLRKMGILPGLRKTPRDLETTGNLLVTAKLRWDEVWDIVVSGETDWEL